MKLNIVKVISTRVVEGFRNIKFLRMGKSDVQETEQVAPHGFDSNPIENMVAVYGPTLQQGEPVILGYINKNQLDLKPGESGVYSTDSNGSLSTFIRLLDNGTMEIGGDDDFMVRFNKLKDGFDALRDDFNSHVSTYNSHVHPFVGLAAGTAGATSPTPATGSPSTATIDPSKISEIKTL